MNYIFDFDGTLVNSLLAVVGAYNRQAKKYNLRQIKISDVNALRGRTLKEMIDYLGTPWLRLPFIFNYIRKELSDNITNLPLYSGVAETLQELKRQKHTIGILTSNSADNIKLHFQEKYAITFDFIYAGSSFFGKGKLLKKAVSKEQLNKHESIYVGDEVRDIIAAHHCGIHSAVVTWGLNSKQLLSTYSPDFIIQKPEELLEISCPTA
ncbi:MAG: HAD-IA family hydrolase [Gammaproteobacteria bacterium]|nr:HAD-IA family hydrolase [Gammaproteobacteria bacterium]